MVTKEGDVVEHLYVASAHSYVLVFTESGRVLLDQGPPDPRDGAGGQGQGDRQPARPRARRRSSPPRWRCASSPRTATWSSPPSGAPSRRPALAPSPARWRGGIIAIKVEEGDRLLAVRVADPEQRRAARHRQGLRGPLPGERRARRMGRVAHGVRGVKLRRGDRVVGDGDRSPPRATSSPSPSAGFGKRTALDEYRSTHRGGLGVINLKVGAKTGEVIAVKQVAESDEVDPDQPERQDHPHAGGRVPGRSGRRPRASS